MNIQNKRYTNESTKKGMLKDITSYQFQRFTATNTEKK